ncbi:hypothetical protein [Ruminococcus sp. YRD2003]|uniref:hypothetical protein n=1 Tax=Ruminococcus sp. YRD2003 TaxID=1452313 RepID=UPI00115FFB61
MKASALNKMESCDRDESIIQVPQHIRLDYAEQYDDDTGGITLGEEVSYCRIKEPKIRNIIAKFNGDRESFELFIKSLLSDYLHAAEVEKSSAEQEADK